ncbi:MAG: hypothetical protein AAF702_08965 [Chloroflexota bacterium]
MSIKNLKKVVVAVALTLAVTFSAGVWEDVTGWSVVPSAEASCVGSGSHTGGGC